jgi:hypothetical protein
MVTKKTDTPQAGRRTITVERAETPLAAFYQRAQPWVKQAACRELELTQVFFHDRNTRRLDQAREYCAKCPVRTECCEQALVEEAGYAVEMRHGIRGWTTPAQRESIDRRGGLLGRDPMLLVQGWDGERRVPPVPDNGDRWSRHHTTLARKTVRWIADNVTLGAALPELPLLASQLHCKPSPLQRVLDALVQDGTLDFASEHRSRSYVRRGTPRAIAEWLPSHLRNTVDEEVSR